MLAPVLISFITIFKADFHCNASPKNLTIFQLDKKINKLMLQPETDKGDEIYQLLFKLHYALQHILEVANQDIDDPAAIETGKEVMRKKGLKIFKAPISEELLKVTYKWNDDYLNEFVDLVTKCKQVFDMFERCIINKGL
uniref:Uncharacterized protein n=1 Tax=Cuerna arida TaxID=1464854 RepID=A0A1B6F6I1_9HEMI